MNPPPAQKAPNDWIDALFGALLLRPLAWCIILTLELLRLLLRPLTFLVIVAYVALASVLNPNDAQALFCYLLILVPVVLGVWRWRGPESFAKHVRPRLRAWWRRATVYRAGKWRTVLGRDGCQLVRVREKKRDLVPKLKRVRSTQYMDRLTVRMVRGYQTRDDWRAKAMNLADGFGANRCRVRAAKPNHVLLELSFGDPLADVVPALPIREDVDLQRVPIGRRDDGEVWTLCLIGVHILIAGLTGSGKASVLWSIVRAVAVPVRDGIVQLWGWDPKGGMELDHGRRMFARFILSDGDPEDPDVSASDKDMIAMAAQLRDLVRVLEVRSRDFAAALQRDHVPTTEHPLILGIIDEVTDLTTYWDKPLRDAMLRDIGLILRKGRAVGVGLIVLTQNPSIPGLPFRHGLTVRVALALRPSQIDMVLDEDAYKSGARCDELRKENGDQGKGWAILEGDVEPTKVRASYVTDEDLRVMSAEYPAHDPTARVERTLKLLKGPQPDDEAAA